MGRGSSEEGIGISEEHPLYSHSCSVFDTTYQSLWNYPSLYFHANEIIDHCLFHYGRGDYWEDGQVKNLFPPELDGAGVTDLVPRSYEKKDPFIDDNKSEAMKDISKRLADERRERVRWVRDNIEILSSMRLPYIPSHGAFDQGSPICNIPDDITPDWAKAAYELIDLTLSASEDDVPMDPTHGDMFKRNLRKNKEFALRAKKRLGVLGFEHLSPYVQEFNATNTLPLVQKVFAEGHEDEWCCLGDMFIEKDSTPSAIEACCQRAEEYEHSYCIMVSKILRDMPQSEREKLLRSDSLEEYGPFHEPHDHQRSYNKRHPLSPEQQQQMKELFDSILNP
jgi:hypothetical protein